MRVAQRFRASHFKTMTPSQSAQLPAENASAQRRFAISMIGRFGWALADQVLSSATNFLLSLLVARTVGSRELGAFSMVYATFTFSLGAVRAIAGELLVVRYSAVPVNQWREGVERAAGTALTGGMAIGLGCLVAGVAVGEPSRTLFAVVGLSLPFLLVQDVWRFAFFARRHGSAAFLNDLVWAAVLFAAFGALRHADVSSIALFTFAWAAAGSVATIVGVLQLKVLPSGPSAAANWLRSHRDIAPRFLAEFAVGTGVTSFTLFVIGGIAGLGELGHLRAGEIALGPLNVLFLGAGLVATAEGVRLLAESPRKLVLGSGWLSLTIMACVLAWGAVVLLAPRNIGQVLLRANWDDARALLPPLLVALAGYASGFGAWTGLRSLAAARRSLRAKCIDGSLTLVFGVTGAYLAGARGVAWGYAVSGWLKSLNAWWQFSRALREYKRNAPTTVNAEIITRR
jgi:O-antigen/teichoic acid export membrane protein